MDNISESQLFEYLADYSKNSRFEDIRQMGFNFLSSGNRFFASLCFGALKDTNPADLLARIMFVQSTIKNNPQSYAAARDEFLAILSEYPSLTSEKNDLAFLIVRNAAHTLIWTNDFDRAASLLEKLVTLSDAPGDVELLKSVYEGIGDFKGELRCCQKLIELDKKTYDTPENSKKIAALTSFLAEESRKASITVRRYPTLKQLQQDLRKVIQEETINPIQSTFELPEGESLKMVSWGGCWNRDLDVALSELEVNHFFLPITDDVNSCAGNLMFAQWLTDPDKNYASPGLIADAKYPPEIIKQKITASNVIMLSYSRAFEMFDKESLRFEVGKTSLFNIQALNKKYQFKLAPVDENVRAIIQTIDLIRKISPNAVIILQISPGTILAGLGGQSAVEADFLSKAMLRVSINEVISRWNLHNVFYWPTIEIFRWIASHQTNYYGGDDGSAWHLNLDCTRAMAESFVNRFNMNKN